MKRCVLQTKKPPMKFLLSVESNFQISIPTSIVDSMISYGTSTSKTLFVRVKKSDYSSECIRIWFLYLTLSVIVLYNFNARKMSLEGTNIYVSYCVMCCMCSFVTNNVLNSSIIHIMKSFQSLYKIIFMKTV